MADAATRLRLKRPRRIGAGGRYAYLGPGVGAEGEVVGRVCFNTAMTVIPRR